MHDRTLSRADLHVHSKYSDRPSEWFLRRIGAPECFVEPQEIYRRMRDRGMDFASISDHNCIDGALEIAELPGTFLSAEVTTYFPEDGCKIHCLAIGITEAQFRAIQELRENVYELQAYFVDQKVISAVAHPLFRVNDRLSIDDVEKLLLLFKRFELINGTRDGRSRALAAAILENLTPELIDRIADRHGIEPTGPEPWKKHFVGGSDDHSGVYGAAAHTVTPYAEDVDEFLAHLRRGDHRPAGASGGSLVLGHGLYHIAYSFYKARFLGDGGGRPSILQALFERLLSAPGASAKPQPLTFGQRLAGVATGFVKARKLRKRNQLERVFLEEISELFVEEDRRDVASTPADDRRTFRIACRVGHVLGYSILRKFERYVREGRLMDSLQTLAALAPVALSLAPYLAAFSSQHKDEPFLQALADHFPAASHLKQASDRKAWITDTFCEFNGVCRTIKTLAGVARKTGKPLTVITCLDQIPPDPIDVKAFRPVGTFPLPEYEVHELSFPPFLDVIEYIERNQFNELIISTPGPLGLTALAAAKLLGIRTTGIYHTDFPMIARCLTDDPAVEQLTWKYMQWFYDSVDWVVAPSEYYRRHLVRHGFDPARLSVLVRGVDRERFNPTKRDEAFWDRYGLARGFKFLYVGRVSADKQVELVLTSFQKLAEQGREASLAIVGDGPSLEELRRRHQDPRIAFTGFLDGEELATAVASADVLVFPSTTDTFGNAVLEAQASGLPAIVSNRGGPQEIVTTHGSGVVVDVAEPGAVAQAMDRLLGDSDLRGDMRRRALRNAAGRGWEQVLDELWNHEDHGARSAPIVDYSQATLQPDPGEIAADVA